MVLVPILYQWYSSEYRVEKYKTETYEVKEVNLAPFLNVIGTPYFIIFRVCAKVHGYDDYGLAGDERIEFYRKK